MRNIVLAVSVSALMAVCPAARADVFSLTPPDADLDDLDHYRYYTWGIDAPWPTDEQVAVSATLSFRNIRDWQWESNVLYIHLLDSAPLGVSSGWDGQGGGDYFEGQGIVLTVYRDLPPIGQDLSYELTDEQLESLNAYAADGRFALGLDPDCHYYNCGVELGIATEVPEPSTVALLAAGAVAVLLRRRRHAR